MTDVHTTLLEAHAWNGRTNDRGIAIIKICEGWPKRGKPHVCPAGYWTQGYGILRGLNGKRVTKNTPPIDKQQGQTLLMRDLSVAEKAVHALVGPRLTPNQFGARVSLVFNIGRGNFSASQISQRLLREDHEGVADIWGQWGRGGPEKADSSRLG